ncbi:hypothetical protein [Blastopirellula retiformator]|uniref:Uncharacterized protein n=1 Tax=Blastopirellula retiformator TaxID=2527970 RepID=A0A5C5V8R6_9BACT|nr:hypothetical protein [Blastopirellula retiformator]TWT34125.1 hypothetical protein Enr8_15180 [Blastopirellula retiformator]
MHRPGDRRRLPLLIGIFSGWALAFDLLFLLPLASFRSPQATEPDAFTWLFVSLISAAGFAVVAGFLMFRFDPTNFAVAMGVKMGAYRVIAYLYPVSSRRHSKRKPPRNLGSAGQSTSWTAAGS